MLGGRPTLLVDGLNFFTRHFCANPTLGANGQAVGGIVGFLNELGHGGSLLSGRVEALPDDGLSLRNIR